MKKYQYMMEEIIINYFLKKIYFQKIKKLLIKEKRNQIVIMIQMIIIKKVEKLILN